MFGIFKKNQSLELTSPIDGDVIDITEVPDDVFAQKMLGDGLAVKPSSNIVVAPCDGKIMQVFPTKHAIGIETKSGIEILLHIGLETVALKGKGFQILISEGDTVKKGEKLVELDLDYIKENAKSLTTPIVITNMDKVEKIEKNFGSGKAGETVIATISIKK